MLNFQNTVAKRVALLTVVGVLSMAVYAWGAPLPADGGAAARPCPGERFRQADSDGDGQLSQNEALRGMPRLARNFQAIDADSSGRVSCDELRAFIQARRKALCEASK